MLKAVFFDLDETLLPLDENKFVKVYFKLLYDKVKHLGYFEEASFFEDIMIGVKLMMKNDGSKTNEEVFWHYFIERYGTRIIKDKPLFDDFYVNEFKKLKIVCDENLLAKEIVKYVKSENLKCILSTNPIFPIAGTRTRMSFVGLNDSDFDYITAYENSSFSKPNPKYFEILLNKFNLKPNEVILFGNNVTEDYECAKSAGINCFLVGNYIIGDLKKEINHIKMNEIIPVIKKVFNMSNNV